MAKNLFDQEQWARRGADDLRLSTLQAEIAALESDLSSIQAGLQSQINTINDDWTQFVPTFFGFTKGSGELQGWHKKIGRTVHVNVRMVWGLTSAWTDFGYLYVPFAPPSPSFWTGPVYANPSGVHHVGVWRSDGTNSGAGGIYFDDGTHINSGNPEAWTVGSVMWATATYRAAA